MTTHCRYNSLEDFLRSHPLTVDAELDDGWGAKFPVKGIEIDATILFADMSGFSRRTKDMLPTEVLIFVNNFISWITSEAVMGQPCIVDKYIGDAVMLLFSKEFGSNDPFSDALQSARWMGERDVLGFGPHIGIASGRVMAGYIGTPVMYNASLFGTAVTIASRCANIKPDKPCSSSIVFPSIEWADRSLREIFPPRVLNHPNEGKVEQEHAWELCEPRKVELRNLGTAEIREIYNAAMWLSRQSAEQRAKECFRLIKEAGLYRNSELRNDKSH